MSGEQRRLWALLDWGDELIQESELQQMISLGVITADAPMVKLDHWNDFYRPGDLFPDAQGNFDQARAFSVEPLVPAAEGGAAAEQVLPSVQNNSEFVVEHVAVFDNNHGTPGGQVSPGGGSRTPPFHEKYDPVGDKRQGNDTPPFVPARLNVNAMPALSRPSFNHR